MYLNPVSAYHGSNGLSGGGYDSGALQKKNNYMYIATQFNNKVNPVLLLWTRKYGYLLPDNLHSKRTLATTTTLAGNVCFLG